MSGEGEHLWKVTYYGESKKAIFARHKGKHSNLGQIGKTNLKIKDPFFR